MLSADDVMIEHRSMIFPSKYHNSLSFNNIAQRVQNKMANILQMAFSNIFLQRKFLYFDYKSSQKILLGVQLVQMSVWHLFNTKPFYLDGLTHWGRVTHICVSKSTINGSDNGLSPGQRRAIIWTSAGILLIGSLRTNFREILIGIETFSFKKMPLKMLSVKWRPFCLGLNVLMQDCVNSSLSALSSHWPKLLLFNDRKTSNNIIVNWNYLIIYTFYSIKCFWHYTDFLWFQNKMSLLVVQCTMSIGYKPIEKASVHSNTGVTFDCH